MKGKKERRVGEEQQLPEVRSTLRESIHVLFLFPRVVLALFNVLSSSLLPLRVETASQERKRQVRRLFAFFRGDKKERKRSGNALVRVTAIRSPFCESRLSPEMLFFLLPLRTKPPLPPRLPLSSAYEANLRPCRHHTRAKRGVARARKGRNVQRSMDLSFVSFFNGVFSFLVFLLFFPNAPCLCVSV